eukprot:COSAG01_NODE_3723_length_5764_cov_1.636540_6_plen_250_part_00
MHQSYQRQILRAAAERYSNCGTASNDSLIERGGSSLSPGSSACTSPCLGSQKNSALPSSNQPVTHVYSSLRDLVSESSTVEPKRAHRPPDEQHGRAGRWLSVGRSERAFLSLERGERSLTQLGRRAVGDSIEQSEAAIRLRVSPAGSIIGPRDILGVPVTKRSDLGLSTFSRCMHDALPWIMAPQKARTAPAMSRVWSRSGRPARPPEAAAVRAGRLRIPSAYAQRRMQSTWSMPSPWRGEVQPCDINA